MALEGMFQSRPGDVVVRGLKDAGLYEDVVSMKIDVINPWADG